MWEPMFKRNGILTEPNHPRRLLEKVMVEQLDILAEMDRLHKALGNHYIHNQDKPCQLLCEQINRCATNLHRLLAQSEKLRGIIANEGKAPKPTGFDYTRYDEYSY